MEISSTNLESQGVNWWRNEKEKVWVGGVCHRLAVVTMIIIVIIITINVLIIIKKNKYNDIVVEVNR